MKKFSVCASLILAAAAIYVFSPAASAQTASTNIELTGLSKQSSVGRIGVTLSGVELEDSFQRQSKTRGLNPAVFREELVGALKELHPGTIRMELPDLGQQLADRFTVPGAAVSGKSVSASAYSLGEFLQLCAEVGSDPWLRIPSGTTPDQMREVVEYLSGTGSDAWSAARIASGQSEPWTQVFGTIHVELGNEYVSGAATSEWMTPAVYAERANTDFGAARDTAGFDSSKFDLMLSGSGVSAQWAAAVLPQSREQNSLAITANLPKLGASASQAGVYAALLAEPEAVDSAGGVIFREVAGLTAVNSARRTSINVGQSRLSLATGSGQLAQSWGAGLAQTEHVLQMMALGVRYQNGAALTENSLHCADESPATNCRSAQFLSDALANGAIGGTMLQTVQTGVNPTRVQDLSGNAVQAHALQSFAFTEGGKVSLVVFNLSPTAALPVTFSGNNAPAGDVQMAQIAPRDITNSNQNGTELQPSKQTLSDSDLSSGLSLPPYSMTVLSWEAGSVVRTSAPAVSGAVKLPNGTEKLPAPSTLATAAPASSSTTSSQPLINCPSGFNSTPGNQCYVMPYLGNSSAPANQFGRVAYITQFNGSAFNLQNASTSGHTSAALNFMTQVNVQAFTTTFQFVPNGWDIALVFNNSNNNPDFNGIAFVAGDGCEGGFFQAFQPTPPNNVFALEFDQWSSLTAGANNFTYSSVQTYTAGQSPCNPNLDQTPYYPQNKFSTSPVPLNSPATAINTTTQDTYSATLTYDGSNLTVNLYDVTKGGTCSPSTSPTCFSHTWTGVDIPTAVGSDTAWVGFTASTNSNVPWNLYLNSFVYTVNNGTTAAATPTFSPVAGTYATAQTVSISDATSGATIYYTTNGTTPTTSSTKYTSAVTVSATETLEAIAVASGYSNSAVASAAYTISPSVPAPTFSPAGGTYTGTQKVTISDTTAGTTIYYTTNGTTPTTSSTEYTGPVTVSATETLKAIAVATGDADAVGTATYTIMSALPAPTFSVAAGTYTSAQTVSVSDATAGTTIYYTTNGTTPTTSSTKYAGAITVSATETLEAIAIETGYSNSPAAIAAYTINPTALAPSTGGTYVDYPTGFTASGLSLTNGASVTGSLLQLTDGGTWESRAAWFAKSVPVQSFTTDFTFEQLNAGADGMTFTIQASSNPVQGADGGGLGYQNIPNSVAVKFDLYNNNGEGSDSTGLYTNGASPTTPSVNLSSTPINLHSGDVMHAHLVYDGTDLTMTLTDTVTGGSVTEVFPVNIPSIVGGDTAYVGFTGGTGGETSTQNVLSWTYSVPAAAPAFSPAGGSYGSAQSVTISDTAAGAVIYYTTNGSTPTTSSTKYTGPVTVDSNEILKAIAVTSNSTSSAVVTANYNVEPGGTTYLKYPTGGFTTSGLALANGASVTGSLLQLTDGGTWESRAAWFAKSVPVQSFTTDFTFQQLNAAADGMTFAIQAGSAVQGADGGGLGYQNIPNSVAIKFDLYNNNGEGSDSTGLYTNGASPTTPSVDLSSTPINLHSGDVMHAYLVYNGTDLTMTLVDTVTGGSVTEVFPVNIPSIVGGDTAYVGFTGGTGGETATQNVLSWTFVGPTN